MKSYIINKHDFFPPRRRKSDNSPHPRLPPNTTFESLPENICVCAECLFRDSLETSSMNQRAIENGREITDAEELSAHERPRRCQLCGRVLYDAHPVNVAQVATQGGTVKAPV